MLALKDLKVTNRHFTKPADGLKPWQTKAANQSKEIFKLQRERERGRETDRQTDRVSE